MKISIIELRKQVMSWPDLVRAFLSLPLSLLLLVNSFYSVKSRRRIVAQYFDFDAVILAKIDPGVDMRFFAKQFLLKL